MTSINPPPLPVIIPSFNRLKLLEQTLTSLFTNSTYPVYPIVIDNGSPSDFQTNLQELADQELIRYYPLPQTIGIGTCRNFGAAIAPSHKFIYFSDNDVYFTPGWDEKMITTLQSLPKIGILGGLRHPYHGVIDTLSCPIPGYQVTISDQQAGYSMLLKRTVWNEVGPFCLTGSKDYGQEDANLCNRFRAAGYQIAALDPGVIIHCGLTRADGTETVGQKQLQLEKAKYPQVYFE
jgi:GT2 family glycosyltransferase